MKAKSIETEGASLGEELADKVVEVSDYLAETFGAIKGITLGFEITVPYEGGVSVNVALIPHFEEEKKH